MSINLTTFEGSEVTSKDDAMITDLTLTQQCGIVKGCELSLLGANQVQISAGYGVIRGRLFKVLDETVLVQLSDNGNLKGRLYIRMDLNDGLNPIQFLSVAAQNLPDLEQDEDVNFSNGVWEMELATYDVAETAISNFNVTVQKVAIKVLDSLDEITANTEPGKIAGALAVKEVAESLSNFARYNPTTDRLEVFVDGAWIPTQLQCGAKSLTIIDGSFCNSAFKFMDGNSATVSLSNGKYIYNRTSSSGQSFLGTLNKIDLSKYKTLKMTYSGKSNSDAQFYLGLSDVNISDLSSSFTSYVAGSANSATVSLDVSSINSEKYVMIAFMYGIGSATIDKIWLE